MRKNVITMIVMIIALFVISVACISRIDPALQPMDSSILESEVTNKTETEDLSAQFDSDHRTEPVSFSAALNEILQEATPDTILSVSIEGLSIDQELESAFSYQGMSLSQCREQPERRAYQNAYEEWLMAEYPGLNEQNHNNPDWEKHSPQELFEFSWKERHSEEEVRAYEQANELYLNAKNAYHEWRDSEDGMNVIRRIWQSECDRLNECGCSLRLIQLSDTQYRLEETATVECLRSFPVKDGYSYWITLLNDDSPISEGASVNQELESAFSYSQTDSKMSDELKKALIGKAEDETIDVYIYLLSKDAEAAIMDKMKNRYPDLYLIYENEDESRSDLQIQLALEKHRELSEEYYQELSAPIIKKISQNGTVLFASSYAPMLIATLSQNSIVEILNEDSVAWMDVFINLETSIEDGSNP